jgi:hypothetical protein
VHASQHRATTEETFSITAWTKAKASSQTNRSATAWVLEKNSMDKVTDTVEMAQW